MPEIIGASHIFAKVVQFHIIAQLQFLLPKVNWYLSEN